MALKVFLSHSLDPGEQALAWRLQPWLPLMASSYLYPTGGR